MWLSSLTNHLKETGTAEKLIRAYEGHNHDTLYSSIMEVIVNANRERFLEVKEVCNALKELMKEELEEREQYGISQGEEKKLLELIKKKLLKGKDLKQIAEELEETENSLLPLYNRLKEEMNLE